MKESSPPEITFELALSRLEQILQKMNSGAVSLEESLTLYEEADRLISSCSKRLNEAERKIEILIKNRMGEVSLGEEGKPLTKIIPQNGTGKWNE